MALNSTSRRRYGALLAAATTAAVAAIIGLASPASAHDKKANAWCDEETATTTLEVDFTRYDDKKPNTIEIKNGDEVVLELTEFGRNYQDEWTFPGDVDYDFHVVVVAWDGEQFGYDKKHPVKACVTETTTTTTTTTTETTTTTTTTTTSEEPTTSPSEEPTTTTTVPQTPTASPTPSNVAGEDDLAETGASIALPLGIAGVLLVGGLVALFVVRRRSRA